jgi:hypothetical protein
MAARLLTLMLTVAAAMASGSDFTNGLPPPVFSDTESCGLMPVRPPRAMLVPPQMADLCDTVRCPRAPNQCYSGMSHYCRLLASIDQQQRRKSKR